MSIRHLVTWTLTAEDPAVKAEHAAGIAERLLPLVDVIDGLESLEVGANVAYPEANWDVAVNARFTDLDALARYQVHPQHVEASAWVRTVVSKRASIDYTL
jgi:Stress responsive A/B Barrel Domain